MNNMRNKILMTLALLITAVTGVWAEGLTGSGTSSDPWKITSDADWNEFCTNVLTYKTGYVKMTADVGTTTPVTTSAGNISAEKYFAGTFDGDGHIIKFVTETPYAPFAWIGGNAIIMNLHVTGSILCNGYYRCGGLAGRVGAESGDVVTIKNCRSSMAVQTTVGKSTRGQNGGFVGNHYAGTLNIEGCLFDGKLTGISSGTNTTTNCGGFVGYNNNNTLNVTNCLFAPSELTVADSGFKTFAYNWSGTPTNSYYTETIGTAQGKLIRTISAGTDVTSLAISGTATEYNVSGITAYATGIKYNDVYYAGDGDEVGLSLMHADNGTFKTYTASAGTLANATTNTPTLTMSDSDVQLEVTYYTDEELTAMKEAAFTTGVELTANGDGSWTLDKMPSFNIELQVEYEPTKVTMAVNDKTMGTAEVAGESKVEWTADTWKGWMSDTKEHTVDDITMTSSESAYVYEYAQDGDYLHSLYFYVNQTDDNSTVTFSTTGDPFSRIEFTMIKDYKEDELFNNRWNGNPTIMPKDNWTFEGKSAVWEGEATKSLTLKSCSTAVSKITFFKGGVPEGVTINGDGTFTVAKTATVTLKATPAEGYKFLYWEDDQTNTNPVREVTIESGMADMTYKAVFAEITYNVTFVEGTNPDPENPEWTATPNPAKTKQTVTVTYTGSKKVIGVKAEKKGGGEPVLLTTITAADNSSFKSGSQTFGDVATVTLTGNWLTNDGSHGGWYCTGSNLTATISVAEANGANITSVKFYTAGGGSAEDKEAPFEVTTTSMSSSDITTYLNGNAIGSYGVSKIEVFGTK